MAATYKQLALALIIILVSAFGWYFLETSLTKDVVSVQEGEIVVAFLLSFGLLFTFVSILIKKSKHFLVLAIILALLALAFFEKNVYSLIAALVFFLTLFLGRNRIKKEKKKSIKFSFWEVNRRGLALALTGMSLMMATAFAFSPTGYRLRLEFPRPLTEIMFDLSEKPIASRFSGYHQDMTIDEFFEMSFFNQLENQLTDLPEALPDSIGEFDLPDSIPDFVIEEKKAEFLQVQKEALSESLNMEVKGGENIKDIVHQFINVKFWRYNLDYSQHIPLVLISIGFTVIKSLTLILKPIIILLGWLLFKILVAFRFILIKKKVVKKEIVKV